MHERAISRSLSLCKCSKLHPGCCRACLLRPARVSSPAARPLGALAAPKPVVPIRPSRPHSGAPTPTPVGGSRCHGCMWPRRTTRGRTQPSGASANCRVLRATLTRARRLLIDTFAAGLVAFVLSMQWRWYISVKRDVKMIKANRLAGVLDRAVLREVDIADFALLGRDKKPEAPKARARSGVARRSRAAQAQHGARPSRGVGGACAHLGCATRRARLPACGSAPARVAQSRCASRRVAAASGRVAWPARAQQP